MDISGAPLRTLRAAFFTALCVTLSVGSHVLLSGAPLPVAPVAGLSVGVFLVAYALAGRERRYPAIAGLLVPLELGADTLFTTGQHACYGPRGGPVTGALHSVGVDLLCAGGGLGTPLGRLAGREGGAAAPAAVASATPWLLLAAHVGVGLAAALWLRSGEAALGRLLRAVAGSAFRPLLVAVSAVNRLPERLASGSARPVPARSVPGSLPLLVHSLLRRGPPCRPAAL
ncbi:hypothetical protein [Streptomyces sp. TP-A0874]|uniref:hypothetical protein n=1 Tax=Streptomyces sp. TP-A0874 TaxID=549819 RepID=UPI000852D3FF|nr:hypothetical protein [Streptomyces sp. TP-A0874]